jgi:GDP-L-fucose synthase
MDVTRLHTLGWHHTTILEQGIRQVWNLVQPTLAHTSA